MRYLRRGFDWEIRVRTDEKCRFYEGLKSDGSLCRRFIDFRSRVGLGLV